MTINPHPKPARKQKSPPRPLGRSEKPIRRSAIKPKNAKRRKSEFARCYHSEERVEFVKGLPCAGCGVVGYSENAHVENGGMGRKADYTKIAPLCGKRVAYVDGYEGIFEGCHAFLHRAGAWEFLVWSGIDLDKAAAETEAAWQAWLRASRQKRGK